MKFSLVVIVIIAGIAAAFAIQIGESQIATRYKQLSEIGQYKNKVRAAMKSFFTQIDIDSLNYEEVDLNSDSDNLHISDIKLDNPLEFDYDNAQYGEFSANCDTRMNIDFNIDFKAKTILNKQANKLGSIQFKLTLAKFTLSRTYTNNIYGYDYQVFYTPLILQPPHYTGVDPETANKILETDLNSLNKLFADSGLNFMLQSLASTIGKQENISKIELKAFPFPTDNIKYIFIRKSKSDECTDEVVTLNYSGQISENGGFLAKDTDFAYFDSSLSKTQYFYDNTFLQEILSIKTANKEFRFSKTIDNYSGKGLTFKVKELHNYFPEIYREYSPEDLYELYCLVTDSKSTLVNDKLENSFLIECDISIANTLFDSFVTLVGFEYSLDLQSQALSVTLTKPKSAYSKIQNDFNATFNLTKFTQFFDSMIAIDFSEDVKALLTLGNSLEFISVPSNFGLLIVDTKSK